MAETGGDAILKEARARLGFEGRVFLIEKPADLAELDTAAARQVEAWYVPNTTLPGAYPSATLERIRALGTPVVFPISRLVDEGGLAAYQPRQSRDDAMDLFAKLTGLVLDGVPPGQIPIERPQSFELVVNVDEAKRLGIRLSDALLKRADRVIMAPAKTAAR
jgi:putative ABC transport system substrate-binding protein